MKGGDDMNWKKAIGYGLLFWVIMYVVVSIFIVFNIYNNAFMKLVSAIIAGIISFVLAGYVKPTKAGVALSYGLTWVIIGLILDAAITRQSNNQIFLSKGLWLGYLLVLLAPLLRIKKTAAANQPMNDKPMNSGNQ